MHYVVGVGNPGEEYEGTRHNVGRDVVFGFAKKEGVDLEGEPKKNVIVGSGGRGKNKFTLIIPETYVNKSGVAVSKFVTSKKKAEDMIVVHDDLDMPVGEMKIVFDRGSGGHKGVESIKRALKTNEFTRIKIGISGKTPGGKLKKPKGDAKVKKHVLGKWSKKELKEIKKAKKKAFEAIGVIMKEGRLEAMNRFN